MEKRRLRECGARNNRLSGLVADMEFYLEKGAGFMEPIFLKPVFKEMIWGGDRLGTDFPYPIPSGHTGECWAVSAHPSGDCTAYSVSGTAPWEGKKLSELWQGQKELFGGAEGEVFPLLTKIIDAKADLSIQVHPNDAYAAEHENGALGKTECWYILDCKADATIVIGHHAKTREELRELVGEGKFRELIREIPVHPGDFFQIEPGCVHAIKGGTLLLETQQSSDITYRLYDYGRLQDGKPRELHLEKSMDVITCPMAEAEPERAQSRCQGTSYVEHLVTCPFYTVERFHVEGELALRGEAGDEAAEFDIFSVIKGSGQIGGIPVEKGAHFILPHGYGNVAFSGDMELIHARPEGGR